MDELDIMRQYLPVSSVGSQNNNLRSDDKERFFSNWVDRLSSVYLVGGLLWVDCWLQPNNRILREITLDINQSPIINHTMLKTKALVLIFHSSACLYLIIQMALGAVYYHHLKQTGFTRSALRQQSPQFVDSRDTLYCSLIFLMILTAVSAITHFIKIQKVPIIVNLVMLGLLVVYIVSTLIFLVNPQETLSQKLVLTFQNNRSYRMPSDSTQAQMISAFYRFYGCALVSLFLVCGPILTGSLVMFKGLAYPDDEALEEDI